MIALPNVGIREQRALALGIAASIVLHATILFMAPGFQAKKYVPELPTLTAVLRTQAQPEAPAATPSPPEPVTPPRAVNEPPKLKPVPETKPEPPKPRAATAPAASTPMLTAPSSSAAPSVPAATGVPAESKPGPVAPASATASPPTAVASSAPSAASASAEPADPTALQSYKIQLAAFAQKYQRYPRQAVEQKWEGIAEVKLTIGENGRIREAVIASSSGHDELDQEAIAMVRKAAPLTEIKSALRNREFSINLPVVFHLKREGG